MAGAIKPPKITGPTIRPRIPVSDEDRKAAMAGMGGERTKSGGGTPPANAPSVPAPEPVAPAATAPAPEMAALPGEAVATLTSESAAVTAAEPVAAAAVLTAPTMDAEPLATAADESTPAPAVQVAEPVAPAVVVSADKPVAPVAAAAPVAATGRRGRKPRPAEAEPLDTEHSVRIAESTWNEIRLNLVLLPKGAENPANIKKYLELAHKHYEAHLRKQGKLPPK